MAALTDLSDVVNRLSGGNSGTPEAPFLWIDNRIGSAAAAATVTGRWTSLWRYNRTWNPTSALPPSTVAAPTAATNGAFPVTNAGGGRTKWLLGGSPAAVFAMVASALPDSSMSNCQNPWMRDLD